MEKKAINITDHNNSENIIVEVADKQKREFIKRFGKYATSAPVGMFVLMTSGTSRAHTGSDTR